MTTSTAAQQQMRRIDEQLIANRQQIAVLQLENVRLEDARLMLASLAEQDAIAAGRPGMAGLQIRVGPPTAEPVLPIEQQRAERKKEMDRKHYHQSRLKAAEEFGVTPDQVIRSNGKWKKRERARRSDAGKSSGSTSKTAMLDRVRAYMIGRVEPLSPGDVIDAFQVRDDRRAKQQVYQAFYVMHNQGELSRDDAGRYTPVREPVSNGNGAAAHP